MPDFSTLCRRQKTLAVQVPYRRADGVKSGVDQLGKHVFTASLLSVAAALFMAPTA